MTDTAAPAAPVHVVGGMLVRDGRVLLGHRTASRAWYADAWDIPGGHVEPGETARAAVERELVEELGVRVLDVDAVHHVDLESVRIDVFTVTRWAGEPVNRAPREHDELRWFGPDDLPVASLAHPGLEMLLRAALAT